MPETLRDLILIGAGGAAAVACAGGARRNAWYFTAFAVGLHLASIAVGRPDYLFELILLVAIAHGSAFVGTLRRRAILDRAYSQVRKDIENETSRVGPSGG